MTMLLAGIGSAVAGAAQSVGSAVGSTVSGMGSLFTGGAGASTAIASILQGTATVLGVMSALDAGKAQSTDFNLKARDTERDQALENLQGIERRASIKKAMQDAQGTIDTSYAASGVDLSFGTAAQAREEAYREADYANEMAVGDEITRGSRLQEQAANYRWAAKRAKRSGLVDAMTGGLTGAASILSRKSGT